MNKLLQETEKFFRKGFWLSQLNKKCIESEAKKLKVSESALVRHIVTNWFKK